ncbi:MAG TPA: hypothetical protein VKZ55_01685 [Microthrixaceae bacterium]|nr:hypothetical protein [Microthrixaceae bacterium]
MTALELLTILCAVAAMGIAAALALVTSRALRAARRLERAAEEFERVAVPAAEELRTIARRAAGEVDRVEDLLEVAGSIGERVDTATAVTYRALTSPVIKGAALAFGTRRAARRLRGRHRDGAR